MELIALLLADLCGVPRAGAWAEHVERAAHHFRVDARVLVSQMVQESTCRQDAVGALGEQGLMQLKRHTVATRGHDRLTDAQLRAPALNIWLGARHLRWALDKCDGDLLGALNVYKGFPKRKGVCRRDSSYGHAILARIARQS
jgi:soluble lytic murein transglycosylase-like protein